MQRSHDLHGQVPDTANVALLLIDVINGMEFPEGPMLMEHALPAAQRIAQLKRRCKRAQIPVIYANDNFGRWRSNFGELIAHYLEDSAPGRPIIELLRPDEDDYFVLKPKHSGFYSTTLDTLLNHLGATTLILTGFAGNICVIFTAHDAYMRDFRLFVPQDCVASNTPDENAYALAHMQQVLKANIAPAVELDLEALQYRQV